VAEFLSTEWVAALDEAARGSEVLAACATGDHLVLEQRVRLPAGGEAVHHLRFDADGARVLPGAAVDPDVVFSTDLETAVGIARGAATAQQALAAGRLQVRGSLGVLTGRNEALAAVDDVFASVRAETSFPPDRTQEGHR
jgi:putative sterol carrier protein